MTELERALVALGRDLDVPAAGDLAPGVRARLAPRKERWGRRQVAVALALVVLAGLAAAFAVPEARSALLRFLRIGGEQIELVDRLPAAVPPRITGLDLEAALGERVSLQEARVRSASRLLELGEPPDRVYLGPRGTVWFLYGTPQDVRLLVSQTPRLAVDAQLLVSKLATEGTRVTVVDVGGARGAFLSGDPHLVFLLDQAGEVVDDAVWLAGNVLVWEKGGITYRLEGDLSEQEALELAGSLR